MTERSNVETELVKATKFKGAKISDRQDYLGALVRAVEKLKPDDYDNISDEAAKWYEEAAAAFNQRTLIPDFEVPITLKAPIAEAELQEDDQAEFFDATEEDENGEATEDTSTVSEGEDVPEVEGAGAETEAEPVKPVKPAKEKKPKKPKVARLETMYDHITGKRDKYDVHIGTKTHEALKMYEQENGATLDEVSGIVTGRHLNILKKLQKLGHKVEKLPGARWKLTHKDEVGK